MRLHLKCLILSAAASLAVHAQSAEPAFEVASIKPSTQPPQPGRSGPLGAPDPTLVTFSYNPLQLLLIRAFNVKQYQIFGPPWLENERFDIRAKIPDGVSRDQLPAMLQNLLVERFGMKFHHETRELPAYDLVVAKGGPKMKDSAGDPALPLDQKNQGDGKPPLLVTTKDKDGLTQLPAGRKGALIMAGVRGGLRLSVRMQTAEEIAQLFTGRPIVNKTGLSGTYDFNLDYTLDASSGATTSSSGSPLAELKDDAPPSFLVAVESLGLKLAPVKVPTDVIVIDHIEKVPTEN